jgi:hypothetical protein
MNFASEPQLDMPLGSAVAAMNQVVFIDVIEDQFLETGA